MNTLIQHAYEGTPVFFQADAYLNATSIATRFGKKPKDYLILDSTSRYIEAIARKSVLYKNQDVISRNSKGRNHLFEHNQIVIVKKGAPENGGGTWIHPKLSVDYARWLDADFAVWCDEHIMNIINGTQGDTITKQQQAIVRMHVKAHLESLPTDYRSRGNIAIYRAIKRRFGVEYTILSVSEFDNLLDFIPTIRLDYNLPKPVFVKPEVDSSACITDLRAQLQRWNTMIDDAYVVYHSAIAHIKSVR